MTLQRQRLGKKSSRKLGNGKQSLLPSSNISVKCQGFNRTQPGDDRISTRESPSKSKDDCVLPWLNASIFAGRNHSVNCVKKSHGKMGPDKEDIAKKTTQFQCAMYCILAFFDASEPWEEFSSDAFAGRTCTVERMTCALRDDVLELSVENMTGLRGISALLCNSNAPPSLAKVHCHFFEFDSLTKDQQGLNR